MNGDDEMADGEDLGALTGQRWEIIYSHLLHVESHWTAQLQNQQQRNATMTSVEGVLLGFLGFGGLTQVLGSWNLWSQGFFLLGIVLLGFALGCAVAVMVPSMSVTIHDWLKPGFVLNLADTESADEAYQRLAEGIARGLAGEEEELPHAVALETRRKRILWQILFLAMSGVVLLVSAVIELITSS